MNGPFNGLPDDANHRLAGIFRRLGNRRSESRKPDGSKASGRTLIQKEVSEFPPYISKRNWKQTPVRGDKCPLERPTFCMFGKFAIG